MRIYLDVCCLNRPFDDQTQERIRLEAEAVLLILERCQARTWQLLGSEAVEYEVSRIPDEEQRHKVLHLASIACVKQVVSAGVQARAEELEGLGFKALDALHIACAEAASADVLLTSDDRMQAKAKEFQDKLHVRVENPILWLVEVKKDDVPKNNSGPDQETRH